MTFAFLGWTSRTQFEETWATLLGVLVTQPLVMEQEESPPEVRPRAGAGVCWPAHGHLQQLASHACWERQGSKLLLFCLTVFLKGSQIMS